MSKNLDRAHGGWGEKLPDWVAALAAACDRLGSQGKVGKQLGISDSAVNQALGRSNPALRLDRIEQKVRGEFMRQTVICPVLGEISTRDCLDYQQRKFRPTNPARVALFKACKTCPNREGACSKS